MHRHPDIWSDEPTREIPITDEILDWAFYELRLQPVADEPPSEPIDVSPYLDPALRETARLLCVED